MDDIGEYRIEYFIGYRVGIRVTMCEEYLDVKADYRIPREKIEEFLLSKKSLFVRWRSRAEEKTNLELPPNSKSASFKNALLKRCETLIDQSDYDGPRPVSMKICNSKSYWGRCTSDKIVSISSYCSYLPDDLLFYILMHEFAHITHMHHKSEFWNLVGLYCPNYKICVQKLKKYHPV